KERGLVYLLANHGVDGIILKEEPGGELLRAVKVIRNRGRFFSALLSSELMSLIKTKKLLQPFLTLREREILQGIAEGKQSQEIAEALNISIFTVHRHRHNIKKKLKIKYTTDLIRYCLKYKDNF
ncbi:MAG: response regulator transcription factor, partial [Syntrophobacterales bacterium]